MDDHWEQFGPGAIGVGWDLALMGLHIHLRTRQSVSAEQVATWNNSDAGRLFMTLSSEKWCEANAAGGATRAKAEAQARRTIAAYTGQG